MKITGLVLSFLMTLWMSVLFSVSACQADLVQTDRQSFYGLIQSEDDESVTFRIRYFDGRTSVKVIDRSEIVTLVRTVDLRQLLHLDQQSVDQVFQVGEELASLKVDHEAYFQLLTLLDWLARQELEPEMRSAVRRLQVQSLRDGVPRMKVIAEILADGESLPQQSERDWQRQLMDRLTLEQRQVLLDILVDRRKQRPWKDRWAALEAQWLPSGEPDGLPRLKASLESNVETLEPALLRMEILLEDGSATLPMPWPDQK